MGSYAFVAPNFAGFLLFTLLPVGAALILSFYRWDVVRPVDTAEFVGLDNFVKLMGLREVDGTLVARDERFWQYLYNTIFLMFGIPIGMAGSLFLAMLMNQKLRGMVASRSIYFLPSILPAVPICLLWQWLLNTQWGLINAALRPVIGVGPAWLDSPALAKPAFMIMGIWAGVGGYNCLLYLAGLQGIPKDLYEAAELDGATWWGKLRHVTLPLLGPTTFFITIMSIIQGFQGGFTQAFLITQGGPAGSTTTLMYFIYQNAFEWFRMGYAAAVAWVLFLLVFGFTLLTYKHGGKRVQTL
ncbi:MAG: ABC transporter permease subunit [Armatimonadia bacterium]|nr:ABC transporter permease subunit [Armatimonadia bacterium]